MSTDRLPEAAAGQGAYHSLEGQTEQGHRSNKVSPEPEARDRAHLLNDMEEPSAPAGQIEMQPRRQGVMDLGQFNSTP